MFIIECLPFSKGLKKDSLSYFSAENLEPGALVKVAVRKKVLPAIVTKSRPAKELKSEIRKADFQVKKVLSLSAKPFLEKEFFEAVRKTAQYFAATEGGLLAHLIPTFILENPGQLSAIKNIERGKTKKSDKTPVNRASILQTGDEERFLYYRSLLREEFAKRKSVFLCLPKNENIKEAVEKLEKGIEPYICFFHAEMNKKELRENWKRAFLTGHPVLIIGTARWLFLPRADLGAVILDNENDSGWRTLSRPFFDLRYFTEILAREKNIKIIFGDLLLRVETLHRFKEGELAEFERVKWRLPMDVHTEVVDMKEITKREKEFKVLSSKLREALQETAAKKSQMFIFAARKGFAGATVCRDCGEQVRCGNCSAPMVLYKSKIKEGPEDTGGVFRCHQCNETRDAGELCRYCGGWRLEAFGLGADRVAAEIRTEVPEIKIFELNSETASTNLQASKIVRDFYGTKGSVLVGTEMAFSYLHRKVPRTALASFDSLFFIPDFRIREKILRLILQTKNLSQRKMILQSGNLGDPIIKWVENGNLSDFYEKELADRRTLSYPPFGTFIKITERGPKNLVSKEAPRLKEIFKNYEAAVFNSVHEKKGEQMAVNVVIKLQNEEWENFTKAPFGRPDHNLLALLRSLPPHYQIQINPDSLL